MSDIKDEKQENVSLSESDVFDVMKFAQHITTNQWKGLGVYTPDLLNATLKQLNMNPDAPSASDLYSALNDPNQYEDELVTYSEWFNNNDMMYKRANGYLANMLSFDLSIYCENLNMTAKDYKSKEYKEDLNRVYKWLNRFNYKREFRNIVNNMLRQETVYTSLREEGHSYALQQLPSDYCKMTGYIPETKLFDFDCYYFFTPGVDIDNFAPVFKEYCYEVTHTPDNDGEYIPSNPTSSRNGSWVLWHQTSPKDGFWVWKFAPELYTKIPYLAPMMKDSINTDLLRKMQTNKDIAGARAIILGEIGFLEKTKSGQVPDQLKLSPEALSMFMTLVKQGLEDVWKIGGLPEENLKKMQFQDYNADMYRNHLTTSSAEAIAMGRALFATDKLSQSEVEVAFNSDANLMKSLYVQFEDFLRYFINKKTKKYKFGFRFEGVEYPSDRSDRLDRAVELADRGIVLPQLFQSALGLSPIEFNAMMDEAKYTEFSEKLTQLMSIHTVGAGQGKRGRPIQRRVKGVSRDYDDSNEE